MKELLRLKLEKTEPDLREIFFLLLDEIETQQRVRQEAIAESQRAWVAIQELTEAKVAELAEAQKRTEAKVAELAEAQKRTEEEVRKLAIGLQQVRNAWREYTLEDRAMRNLPTLLSEHGIEVEGRLVRRYVLIGDIEQQVNVFGYGKRGGERVLILGESKVRPSRKEIDRFIDLAERLGAQEGLPTVLLFVAYDFHPQVDLFERKVYHTHLVL